MTNEDPTTTDTVTLQRETFRDFPLGEFPSNYRAYGEYHYWPLPGYRGNWYEPTTIGGWPLPRRLVLDSDGRHLMTQTAYHPRSWPMLVTGDLDWQDYRVTARVRPLSFRGPCGIVARYQDSRNFYAFGFDGNGTRVQLTRRTHDGLAVLAEAEFAYDCDTTYTLTLAVHGDRLVGAVDGVERCRSNDSTFGKGRVALWAICPARYGDVEVTTTRAAAGAFAAHRQRREQELADLRAQNPKPVLWRTIKTTGFGTGRHLRFGDLDGDGRLEILFIQHQKMIDAGNYPMISCPIAVALDGDILWRIGHAQRLSVGRYRPDLPGLQYAVVTFWGNAGIVLLYGAKGRRLHSLEPTSTGNVLSPVNWTGDGQEYALLTANSRLGGLLDGWGRRVVTFPDDGHPDLCAEALDLTGDRRDELVAWDQDRLFIYTQDTPFTGERLYAPERSPHHNFSDYRADQSLPAWQEVRPG